MSYWNLLMSTSRNLTRKWWIPHFDVLYMQVWRHKQLSVCIRFGFGVCRARVGLDSGMCRPTPRSSVLCRTWFGLASVSGRPTSARYITDLRPTNHVPSVAELSPTCPRMLPDKTDSTPTHNRQPTDNLSGRDLSNMFERSLPDKFDCPNTYRSQTDKTDPRPTANRSLPEFNDFGRFEVGFVSVWQCDWGITMDMQTALRTLSQDLPYRLCPEHTTVLEQLDQGRHVFVSLPTAWEKWMFNCFSKAYGPVTAVWI